VVLPEIEHICWTFSPIERSPVKKTIEYFIWFLGLKTDIRLFHFHQPGAGFTKETHIVHAGFALLYPEHAIRYLMRIPGQI
jgi:hypothetical protein